MSIKDYQNGFALGKACAGIQKKVETVNEELEPYAINYKYKIYGGNTAGTYQYAYSNDYPKMLQVTDADGIIKTGVLRCNFSVKNTLQCSYDNAYCHLYITLACYNASGTALDSERLGYITLKTTNIDTKFSIDLSNLPSGTVKVSPYVQFLFSNSGKPAQTHIGEVKVNNFRFEEA